MLNSKCKGVKCPLSARCFVLSQEVHSLPLSPSRPELERDLTQHTCRGLDKSKHLPKTFRLFKLFFEHGRFDGKSLDSAKKKKKPTQDRLVLQRQDTLVFSTFKNAPVYSSSVTNCFILVRVMVNLKSTTGTLGMKQEYTIYCIYRAPCAFIFYIAYPLRKLELIPTDFGHKVGLTLVR